MSQAGPDSAHRAVRSYHQRKGKITPTQQRGLEQGWKRFGVEHGDDALDLPGLFGDRPVVVDIGFGMGESLLELAASRPDLGVLGVEVHERGVGQALAGVIDQNLSNVRIVRSDAAEVIAHLLPDESVDGVRLFFPDPWPKARHHKRRLVKSEWARQVVRVLRPGGYLYCATDWEPYAEHMQLVLGAETGLTRRDDLVPMFRETRPTTKYEALGIARGHKVTDLVYLRAR